MRTIIQIITATTVVLSFFWLHSQGGYDPLITGLTALAGLLATLVRKRESPPDLLVDRHFIDQNHIPDMLNAQGWELVYCDPNKRDAYLEDGYEFIALKDKRGRKRTLALRGELPLKRRLPTKEVRETARREAEARLERLQQEHLQEHGWEPIDSRFFRR